MTSTRQLRQCMPHVVDIDGKDCLEEDEEKTRPATHGHHLGVEINDKTSKNTEIDSQSATEFLCGCMYGRQTAIHSKHVLLANYHYEVTLSSSEHSI